MTLSAKMIRNAAKKDHHPDVMEFITKYFSRNRNSPKRFTNKIAPVVNRLIKDGYFHEKIYNEILGTIFEFALLSGRKVLFEATTPKFLMERSLICNDPEKGVYYTFPYVFTINEPAGDQSINDLKVEFNRLLGCNIPKKQNEPKDFGLGEHSFSFDMKALREQIIALNEPTIVIHRNHYDLIDQSQNINDLVNQVIGRATTCFLNKPTLGELSRYLKDLVGTLVVMGLSFKDSELTRVIIHTNDHGNIEIPVPVVTDLSAYEPVKVESGIQKIIEDIFEDIDRQVQTVYCETDPHETSKDPDSFKSKPSIDDLHIKATFYQDDVFYQVSGDSIEKIHAAINKINS